MNTEYWNNRASNNKSIGESVISRYSSLVCLNAVVRGLSLCKIGNVLKTDLWNEGVEPERDVLSHFDMPNLVGMDISKLVCLKAHKRLQELRVTQGDFRQLPFKGQSIQAIIDLSTIDHVSESDAARVIQDYTRILSQDGVLFLAYAQNTPFACMYWGNMEGVYVFNASTIGKELRKHFDIIEDRGLNILPNLLLLPPKRWFSIMLWHLPRHIQNITLRCLLFLEDSVLTKFFKGFIGMRLHIAIKRRSVT